MCPEIHIKTVDGPFGAIPLEWIRSLNDKATSPVEDLGDDKTYDMLEMQRKKT